MRSPSTRRNPGEKMFALPVKARSASCEAGVDVGDVGAASCRVECRAIELVEGGVHRRDVGHDVGHQALAWALA